MKEEKGIAVSFLANSASSMTLIAMYQYGILLINEQYTADKSSRDYVSNQLSKMLHATQLLQIPSAIVGGFLLDKVRIWPILLAIAGCQVALFTCFYITSNSLVGANLTAGEKGSILQDISFTLILFLNSLNFQVNYTHFGKALEKSA